MVRAIIRYGGLVLSLGVVSFVGLGLLFGDVDDWWAAYAAPGIVSGLLVARLIRRRVMARRTRNFVGLLLLGLAAICWLGPLASWQVFGLMEEDLMIATVAIFILGFAAAGFSAAAFAIPLRRPGRPASEEVPPYMSGRGTAGE